MSTLPRVQAVVLPILRDAPALSGVSVVSEIPDIDQRTYPLLYVRRAGGPRNPKLPSLMALPLVGLHARTPLRGW